jgi:hypothetical protein
LFGAGGEDGWKMKARLLFSQRPDSRLILLQQRK